MWRLRLVFILLYLLAALISGIRVRFCLIDCIDKHILAQTISIWFCVLTLPVSCYHILEHLCNFKKLKLQANVVRILCMVPVFSIESALSIHFVEYAAYFQFVRETYESYVIYCFLRYLLHYLGDSKSISDRLATKPSHIGVHKAPMCCLPIWTMGAPFLNNCKAGVLQCVIIRFLLNLISLALHLADCYDPGDYSLSSASFWMSIVNCISQSYALYALFLFYHALHSELMGIRPFSKFLSIKLVIFFSWWQGMLIGILVSYGHIGGIGSSEIHDGHSAQEVADGIQRLLICMEMFFAAVAFQHAFPVSDFRITASQSTIPEYTALGSRQNMDNNEMNMIIPKAAAPIQSGQRHLPASSSHPVIRIPVIRNRAATYGLQNTIFAAEKSIEDMFDDSPRPQNFSPARIARHTPTSSSFSHLMQTCCQSLCPSSIYRELSEQVVSTYSDLNSDRTEDKQYSFLQAAYATFITGDLKEDLKEFGVQSVEECISVPCLRMKKNFKRNSVS